MRQMDKKIRMAPNKRIIAVCTMTLMLFSAGCITEAPKNTLTQQNQQEDTMDKINLTAEETELLCATFSGEERIRRGDLVSHERALVGQLRFGMEYLTEKYPGRTFVMSNCIPQNKENSHTSLTIRVKGEDVGYELHIQTLEDGSYEASDDYYAVFIRDDYQTLLSTIASESSAGFLAAWAGFPYLYGESYDSELTLDAALNGGPNPEAEGAVYYDGAAVSDHAAATETLALKLKEKGCRGTFWVYYVKEQPENWSTAEELRDFVNEKRYDVIEAREQITL